MSVDGRLFVVRLNWWMNSTNQLRLLHCNETPCTTSNRWDEISKFRSQLDYVESTFVWLKVVAISSQASELVEMANEINASGKESWRSNCKFLLLEFPRITSESAVLLTPGKVVSLWALWVSEQATGRTSWFEVASDICFPVARPNAFRER